MTITITTDGTTSDKSANIPIYYYYCRNRYEEDLERRQQKHLEKVFKDKVQSWRPCFHDSCPSCIGTGVKSDGSPCVHNISCPCPKCTTYC